MRFYRRHAWVIWIAALTLFLVSAGAAFQGTHTECTLEDGQTITGLKVFSQSPAFPTPSPGDSSTKAATTAFVQAALSGIVSGVSSVFGRTGAVTAQAGDYTAAQVGLGSVTNDSQTKAAVMPNTAPSAGQVPCGNAGNTAYAPCTIGSDATLASTGALTLATVNSGSGSCGDASHICQVTTDGKGRVTSQSAVAITAGSSASTLNKQDPQSSPTTCNSSNQTIYTYSMPGNSLASGKCLDVTLALQRTNGTTGFNPILITFGGNTVADSQITTGGSSDVFVGRAKVCNKSASTANQWSNQTTALSNVAVTNNLGNGGQINSFSVDTTGSVTIAATVNCTSPAAWEGMGWTVVTEP